MNEQQLKEAFMQYLQQKSGAQTQQEFEAYVQQLGEEGLQQEYAQFMQMIQQQQVAARKFGGMLNYVEKLRGICPEGTEMQFFKKGGQICKKCVQKAKMEEGGKAPQNPVDAFKCGRKMKKKACGGQVKKNQQGNKLPTEESIAQRYGNAEYYAAPIDGQKYPNNGYNSIYEEGYVQNAPFYKNPAALKGIQRVTRQAGSYDPAQRNEYETLKRRFNEVFPRGNGKLPSFAQEQMNQNLKK